MKNAFWLFAAIVLGGWLAAGRPNIESLPDVSAINWPDWIKPKPPAPLAREPGHECFVAYAHLSATDLFRVAQGKLTAGELKTDRELFDWLNANSKDPRERAFQPFYDHIESRIGGGKFTTAGAASLMGELAEQAERTR